MRNAHGPALHNNHKTRNKSSKARDTAEVSAEELDALSELEDDGLPEELSLGSAGTDSADDGERQTRTPRLEAGILRQVKACLSRDRSLGASGLSVHMERGIVVIEGTVAHDAQRTRILDAVSECSGVSIIRSRIRLDGH